MTRKFLLIINDMDWFWSHRLPLAKAIMREGYDLHVATNGAANDAAVHALGITGHDLPKHTGSFNPLQQLKLAVQIFKILKKQKPDIVHAITLRHAFYTGLATRLTLTKRAVFTLAGLGPLFLSDHPKIRAVRTVIVPFFRLAFAGKGRFVIFQNPDDAASLVKARAIDGDSHAVILGSGVDMAEFAYTPEPESDAPIVLFSSRLLKAKGVGEFVHAARILRSKGWKARFQIAGDICEGNHDSVARDELEEWIREGTVEWLGQRRDMPSLMAGCAIVALPSYYGEGVPKILLEAASAGRPIVTTDMPGCRETVEEGVNGYCVPPKDSWALAAALEKLLADKDLRAEMGRKGRARAEKLFTVEHINAQTLAVYRQSFEGKGPPAATAP